jgi:hypothetical protein
MTVYDKIKAFTIKSLLIGEDDFIHLLKREVGEIPTRSRHCKVEISYGSTVSHRNGKEYGIDDAEPGDLPN